MGTLSDSSLNHFQSDHNMHAVCACRMQRPAVVLLRKLEQGSFTSEQWVSIWIKFMSTWSSLQEQDFTQYYWPEPSHLGIDWAFPLLGEKQKPVKFCIRMSSSRIHWPAPGDGAGPVNSALMTAVVLLIYTIGLCFGFGGPLGNLTWSALWN